MAASAVAKNNKGVALLVAVIFTSVMLAFGILIGSLGYKQTLLTQSVKESQHAFYAADTGMECILYADQALNAFTKEDGTSMAAGERVNVTCDGQTVIFEFSTTDSITSKAIGRYALNGNTRCVDISVFKPINGIGKTWIFSQGYSTDCNTLADPQGKRFSSRGMRAHY